MDHLTFNTLFIIALFIITYNNFILLLLDLYILIITFFIIT